MASLAIPKTQRQWQQTKRGLPQDCLQLVEAPIPKPGPGEILVQIAYVTPTPSSWKIIMGGIPSFLRKGAVPEIEATGQVVDANGSEFAVGNEVTCILAIDEHLKAGRGALTEYALFKAELTFPIPAGFSLESATGILSNGMTAYKALLEVGKIQSGSRVLINGGTTACGMAGIQTAKILGAACVAVSCSAESFGLVRDLGADKAIDYKLSPLPDQLTALYLEEPFDIILDCVGSRPLFAASPSYLKADGVFVTIVVDAGDVSLFGTVWHFAALAKDYFQPSWLGGVPRRLVLSPTPIERLPRMTEPLKWAEEGRIKHLIDSVHTSNKEGVLAAYARGMSGRAKGKILINMQKF